MSNSFESPMQTGPANGPLTWLALLIAILGLAGSLLLSLGLNLKACPLCFYQRTFMMSVVAVLAVGLLFGAGRATVLSLFALPMATGGLGVAAFHVSLELTGKLECPTGVLAMGSAPQQSLAAFVVLFAILAVDGVRARRVPAMIGAIVIGGLLALASCTSNPPMPPAPTQPYPAPPDICRPPFRGT